MSYIMNFRIQYPLPGSKIVGPVELRKREHENKTGGKWGGQRQRSLPSTLASSSLSECLEKTKDPTTQRQRERRLKSEFAFFQSLS